MSCIFKGEVYETDLSKNAKGGTELLRDRLMADLQDEGLLEKVAIHCSRPMELYNGIPNILWCHDLPGDDALDCLEDEGWKEFDHFVFVSHWQMEAFARHYKIPYSISSVIPNSVDVCEKTKKFNEEEIRLVYTSTPHRGLGILVPVFEKLAETDKKIHLDVFSSYELYGWTNRDAQYKELFDRIKDHGQMTYHGTKSNNEIREHLQTKADIFAYPSIWKETSCLSLIEAMCDGLLCVHPNLAALPETSKGLTWQYQWNEIPNEHANLFMVNLMGAIDAIRTRKFDSRLQQTVSNNVHSRERSRLVWKNFLSAY